MQSPPLEFAAMFAAPLAINLLRNAGDPDFDTISESVRRFRDWLDSNDLPGDWIIVGGVFVSGACFCRHICRPRWARTTT
jgi:hypothetical protein